MTPTRLPLLALALVALALPARAQRLKDVASIQGVRPNQLKGMGLVVGLAGTGDSDSALSRRPLANLMERLNLKIPESGLKSKNVALVMVTAMLPPFTRAGKQIDVQASSMADAQSLRNGTLLPTYLYGPGFRDQTVYAVAQGAISVARTHLTTGAIPNGAIVEEELKVQVGQGGKVVVLLDRPDFSTAQSIVANINQEPDLQGKEYWAKRAERQREGERQADPPAIARAVDAGTIEVAVTPAFTSDVPAFIALLEQIAVTVHNEARIVINEATGIVIINAEVRVRPVAIIATNVTLNVPPPGGPPTTVVPLGVAPTTQLQQIIDGLNAMRVSPKDLIDIIKELKAAGAIQAKVEIR